MRVVRFLSVLAVLVCLCDLSHGADFFIWDGDQNHNSGLELRATLVRAGYDGAYDTTIAPYLGSLPNYRAIFLCMGVFPLYGDLTEEPVAVESLVSYLTNYDSTNIYLEGGQEWTLNRYHNLNPYFNI